MWSEVLFGWTWALMFSFCHIPAAAWGVCVDDNFPQHQSVSKLICQCDNSSWLADTQFDRKQLLLFLQKITGKAVYQLPIIVEVHFSDAQEGEELKE